MATKHYKVKTNIKLPHQKKRYKLIKNTKPLTDKKIIPISKGDSNNKLKKAQ